jgi:hypothetical protein
MAARLQGIFYGEQGTRIGVTIDDPDYTGDPIDFNCLSLQINWRGDDGKERFSSIIGSEARFSILVQNEDQEAFITDLVGAEEGRFTVNIGTSDGFYIQTRWAGYITTDLASIEDTPLEVGYSANISAVDGLGVLKGINYQSSASYPYTGDATMIEHLLNCINQLPFVATYYGTFEPILRVVCNWHNEGWTYSASKDPLQVTRVNHGAFYYIDNKGNYRFSTCYDVLEAIATAWGARIMFSGTSFWFIQVNEYTNIASTNVFAYTSDGTQSIESGLELRLTNNQATPESTDLLRFSGGYFQFFAPLKTVQVDYKHIQTRNLLPGFTISNSVSGEYESPEVFKWPSDVFLSYSANLRLATEFIPGSGFQPFYLVFEVKVQIDNRYLKGGFQNGEPQWTTNLTDRYYIVGPVFSFENQDAVFSISFVTPPLGTVVDSTLVFSFGTWKAFYLDGSEVSIDLVTGDILPTYELFSQYLEAVGDGFFDEQSDLLRYRSTNDSFSTKEAKLTTTVGNGPNTITPGHLEIYNGTDWVTAEGWRVGNSGSYKAFSQLLCNEIIKGQLTVSKRLTGFSYKNMNAPYLAVQPHIGIYYETTNYVCQNGTWDLKTEIFSGDWFKLQAGTGYTEQAVEYVPEGTDSGAATSTGSGSTGSSGGGGTSTGGGNTTPAIVSVLVFVQEFINTSSNVLTITENGGNLPATASQVKVFMNGQKLLSSQYTVGTSTITISTDTHYDTANYEVEFIIIQ